MTRSGSDARVGSIPPEAWQPIRDHWGGGLSEAEWDQAKRKYPGGAVVTARVLADLPMGPFAALAPRLVRRIEAPEVSDDPRGAATSHVIAVVLQHVDHNQQIRLSTRESALRRAADDEQ